MSIGHAATRVSGDVETGAPAVGEPTDGSVGQPSAGGSVGSGVGVAPSVGGPKSVQSPASHS